MAELRGRRYDLVLDCQGLGRSGLMAWATRSPRRLGPRGDPPRGGPQAERALIPRRPRAAAAGRRAPARRSCRRAVPAAEVARELVGDTAAARTALERPYQRLRTRAVDVGLRDAERRQPLPDEKSGYYDRIYLYSGGMTVVTGNRWIQVAGGSAEALTWT